MGGILLENHDAQKTNESKRRGSQAKRWPDSIRNRK